MPITQSESGLSQEQYNKLVDPDRMPAWKVIAKRYNLNFEKMQLTQTLPVASTVDTDSIFIEDEQVIAHVANGKIFVITADGTEMPEPAEISGYANDARNCSLYNEDTTLYIYWYSGNAIRVTRYLVTRSLIVFDGQGSIGLQLGNNEVVTHIAASSRTSIHYVVKNTVKRNYNLRNVELLNGVWENTSSDIYWMYPIDSFDVANHNNLDVITLSSQMPGLISLKTEAETVKKYLEASGGVSCFTYQYRTWSDHIEVDVIDNVKDYRLKINPRINVINGIFCITAYSINGSSENSFSSYRLYTSKNGIHWSMGTAMPFPATQIPNNKGINIIKNNDYIYAMDSSNVWRSDSVFELELSSPAVEEDITDDILALNISHEKIMEVSLELDTSDGKYDDHYFINEESVITLELHAGVYDDDGTPILIQIALVEVETLDKSFDPTSKTLTMRARDRVSWINDKTQAEEAKFWQGQLQGGDNYSDYTETGFGGLGHTAVQTGTWAIEKNKLALQTSDETSIAFSSFSPYISNGSYKTSFSLSKANNKEKAGIIFRAIDKENFLSVTYFQQYDNIVLEKTFGGTRTSLASADNMGWTNVAGTYHLMVEFRYGLIQVFTSTNGVTWDLKIEHQQEGVPNKNTYGSLILDKGYVGVLARGYSDASGWTQSSTITNPTVQTSSIDFDSDVVGYDVHITDPNSVFSLPYIENDDLNLIVNYSVALAWNSSGTGAFTSNLNEASPDWSLIDPPIGNLISMCIDYDSEYPKFGTGKLGAYCVSVNQVDQTQHIYVYHIDDCFESIKIYDLVYSMTDDSISEIDYGVIVQSDNDFNLIGITLKRRINPIIIWTTNTWQTADYHINAAVYDEDARKTTAWFNNYGKYITTLPYYLNTMENDGRLFIYDTNDGSYIEKTVGTPSYSSPHVAKLDDFSMWNFITENIGYNQDNNSPYNMSYFYDSMDMTDSEFNALSEDTRWERTAGTSWIGPSGETEVGTTVPYSSEYGLVAYAEDTYAFPSTESRVCRVELNYNFLDPYSIKRITFKARYHDTCCSNTNTFSSTLTVTGQSNNGDVQTFGVETYTSTNLDLITFEMVIDVYDVTSLTFQLDSIRTQDMSGTAQVWVDDIMFTLMNENGEEVIEDTNNGVVFLTSNYNTDSNAIDELEKLNRAIIYNNLEFSRVLGLSSSRNYRNACLALCKTEDGSDLYIAYTTNYGFNWTVQKVEASELDSIYFSPQKYKYIYGNGKLDYFSGGSITNLLGNLDDIWPINWSIVGMETL